MPPARMIDRGAQRQESSMTERWKETEQIFAREEPPGRRSQREQTAA